VPIHKAGDPTINSKDEILVTDASAQDANGSRRRDAAIALAASFFAMFCLVGLALWGLPFYYDFMVRDFGWTRAQVTSGNAFSKLLIGPIFGFFAGWLVDRFGPRRLMIAGVLIAGVALIGLGSISTLVWFYFFYMFNALGYVCGALPTQVIVSRWFVKSRGKAMGLAYLGIGFGGAAVPWVSSFLYSHYGWQTALRTLGGLVIVISLPFALLMKEPPAPKSSLKVNVSADLRKAFKTLALWLIILGSMCSIAAVSGAQQNLKLLLSFDRQYGQNLSARILSLVLACSIIGRILFGWMADRFSKRYVMLSIYLLVAVAIPFLFLGESIATIEVAAAIFGVALGGDYMIIPLMTAEIFGLEILGRLMGVILAAGGVAEALSPWCIGYLRDATGTYRIGCAVLVAMALLGAGAVLMLPARRRTA
jgi:MFS family permease